MFDWLAPRVCGACALDLFAGSGALGLEALSRDAAVVRFVEQSPVALAAIRDSVATLGAVERSRVEQAEALSWLGATAARPNRDDEKFELVFLDPPYASDIAAMAPGALVEAGWIGPETLLIVETRRSAPVLPEAGFTEVDCRGYGDTALYFLKAAEPA